MYLSQYLSSDETYLHRPPPNNCVASANKWADRAAQQDLRGNDFLICRRPTIQLGRRIALRCSRIQLGGPTTGFIPFRLIHGQEVQTMLDAMLLSNETEALSPGTEEFVRCSEGDRPLARF